MGYLAAFELNLNPTSPSHQMPSELFKYLVSELLTEVSVKGNGQCHFKLALILTLCWDVIVVLLN